MKQREREMEGETGGDRERKIAPHSIEQDHTASHIFLTHAHPQREKDVEPNSKQDRYRRDIRGEAYKAYTHTHNCTSMKSFFPSFEF